MVGTGMMTLAGNSTYVGPTIISAGTLQTTAHVNVLPATTALTVAALATFDLGGGTQTVASLSDATPGNGGTVQNSGVPVAILTLSAAGGSTTFSGLIGGNGNQGNLSVVVAGAGLQNLAGSNNYTGGAQVSRGTLQLGERQRIGHGRRGGQRGSPRPGRIERHGPQLQRGLRHSHHKCRTARDPDRQPEQRYLVWRHAPERRRRALTGLQRREQRPIGPFRSQHL